MHPDGVNPAARNQDLVRFDIRGGKTETPSTVVPFDDRAAETVRSTEKCGSFFDASLQDHVPGQGAADHGVTHLEGIDDLNLETQFFSKGGQIGFIPLLTLSKGVIMSDKNLFDTKLVPQDGTDEFLCCHL